MHRQSVRFLFRQNTRTHALRSTARPASVNFNFDFSFVFCGSCDDFECICFVREYMADVDFTFETERTEKKNGNFLCSSCNRLTDSNDSLPIILITARTTQFSLCLCVYTDISFHFVRAVWRITRESHSITPVAVLEFLKRKVCLFRFTILSTQNRPNNILNACVGPSVVIRQSWCGCFRSTTRLNVPTDDSTELPRANTFTGCISGVWVCLLGMTSNAWP